MNPEFGAAHNNRAFARQQKGDIEGAMADFDAAIQCSPGRAYVYNNRGVARRTQGDMDGALADFIEAIRLKAALRGFLLQSGAH